MTKPGPSPDQSKLKIKRKVPKCAGTFDILWHRLIASYYIYIIKLEISSLMFQCKNCVPKSPKSVSCFLLKCRFLQYKSIGLRLTSSNTPGPKAKSSNQVIDYWESGDLTWLDGASCTAPETCSGAHADLSDMQHGDVKSCWRDGNGGKFEEKKWEVDSLFLG